MTRASNCPALTGISICSGIGGLDLGVERALGVRTVAYVERDAFAQACLLARMEEEALECAPIFFDVAEFDGKPFRGVVDVVFGGIPCQPHSVAGKQQRQADDRDLVDEFLRIVGEVDPRFAILENVRGFLARDGLGRLLGGLSNLGFNAEWEVVSAAQVGAPHRRERVFVLAYRNGMRFTERHSIEREGAQPRRGVADLANPKRSIAQRRRKHRKLRGSSVALEGKGNQQERCGYPAHASSEDLGDPSSSRLEGHVKWPEGGNGRSGLSVRTSAWPPSPGGDWSEVPEWLHPALPNADSGQAGTSGAGQEARRATEGDAAQSRVCGVAYGISSPLVLAQQHRTDRLKCLGNGCVPVQAEVALRALARRAGIIK